MASLLAQRKSKLQIQNSCSMIKCVSLRLYFSHIAQKALLKIRLHGIWKIMDNVFYILFILPNPGAMC